MNDKTNNYFENHLQAHPENFEYKIIATAPSKNIANELEKMYIRIWKTLKPNGYNTMPGGDGCDGEIMSEIKKQYYEEHPEAAEEHSKKMIKYYEEHPEERYNLANYMAEHPEAREEATNSLKEHYKNPENIEKNRQAQLKYYEEHPEAKEENSKRMKKYYEEHPEARERVSKQHKGLHAGGKNPAAIKVICHTGEYFDCQNDAGKWAGLSGEKPGGSICSAVKGKTKTAGEHPDTGERLRWYRLDSPEGQEVYNKFYN